MKRLQGKTWKRLTAVSVAAVLILIGILSGEASAVFEKASRICLECIGIG